MTDTRKPTVFEIVASASVQTVLKLLNYFAQRDILPSRVMWETSDDFCTITIEAESLSAEIATIIAEKMRNQVQVKKVLLTICV
jgi:hypothetical protein